MNPEPLTEVMATMAAEITLPEIRPRETLLTMIQLLFQRAMAHKIEVFTIENQLHERILTIEILLLEKILMIVEIEQHHHGVMILMVEICNLRLIAETNHHKERILMAETHDMIEVNHHEERVEICRLRMIAETNHHEEKILMAEINHHEERILIVEI